MSYIDEIMESIGIRPEIWTYKSSEEAYDDEEMFVCWDENEQVWKEYHFAYYGGYPTVPSYSRKTLTERAANAIKEKYGTTDIEKIQLLRSKVFATGA